MHDMIQTEAGLQHRGTHAFERVCVYMHCRGVATNFRLGDGFRLGGRIQVNENHLPPNSYFSSDFGHIILEISENLKILTNKLKNFIKNRDFWGDIPPEFRTGGDTSPPSPPVATPIMHCMHYQKPTASITLRERYC